VSVTFAEPEPEGLAELLGRLIEQNLARDPSRRRLLRRRALVAIEAVDAQVGATLRIGEDRVRISMVAEPAAPVRIAAEGRLLFSMVAAPTRLGLPDVASAEGRAVVGAILTRRIRVRGLVTRFPDLRRLTMLLTAS
jgi:hypothetical protein